VNTCPNQFPTLPANYRIAFIGEAPGLDEINAQKPFVGSTGFVFTKLLTHANITRDSVFLGNVCQTMPTGKRVFKLDNPKVLSGLAQLRLDINQYKPNLVVLLGNLAMKAAGWGDRSVLDWRGSIMKCIDLNSTLYGYKCMATFHPAYVVRNSTSVSVTDTEGYSMLRSPSVLPLFKFDLQRARREGHSSEINTPKRNLEVSLSTSQVIGKLEAITPEDTIAIDIEGGVNAVTCMSIATDPWNAFIVAFGEYSPEDELLVTKALSRVMSDSSIGKILQNCLYDNFVMAYTYQMPIRGICDDTMLSGWELYPELPKSLAVQTSIYTNEQYYKNDRTTTDKLTHYEYCCKDSCVTYEIFIKHRELLSKDAASHYRFNMGILPILEYIQLKGIKYDHEAADRFHARVDTELNKIKTHIDTLIGAKTGQPSDININSSQQLCVALYDQFKFKVQHPKEGGKLNRNKRFSGIDAILKLNKMYSGPEAVILKRILTYRKWEKYRQSLDATNDKDGRRRGGYNVVGTETGRTQCRKASTGNGVAMQGVTKKLRHLYIADEGMFLFQCDLAGADGWTVAAHCKALGDPTMWDDYMFGIKPAKVLVLMYTYGGELSKWTREQIKTETTEITEEGPEGWLYFACKQVQHGTNYSMFKDTMSTNILKASWNKNENPIYMSPKDCANLQSLYLNGRYQGVRLWQNWVRLQLKTHGKLGCASGHVRAFFGRKSDPATFRTGLSHEPQSNTTYATNLAMSNLWRDPHNRRPDGGLRIQPLHQVHDAVIGQFSREEVPWAIGKIRSYFDNEIRIAGEKVKIPFDGSYGRSWGELEERI